VLRFEAEMNHRISAHIDSPGTNGHLLSVVVSLSNHFSGSFEMSNGDDGTKDDKKDSFYCLCRSGASARSTRQPISADFEEQMTDDFGVPSRPI
jgi:hypothetical protein